MASDSKRRSSSSGRSKKRRRVSIGTTDTEKRHKASGSAPKRKRPADSGGSAGKTASAGDRKAAARREERERRLVRQRRVQRLKIVGVVVVVAAVLFGIYSLYTSQVFAVEEIEVIGAERLTEERVLEIAAIPADATLLRFPGSDVAQRLEEDPWIAEATVARDFPRGMRIRIEERVPAAYVDLGGESVWLIDSSGVVIAEQSAAETQTLVVIRDLQPIEPEPGVRTGSEPLLNALQVWAGLSPELQSITRAVSASSVDKTALVTTDEIEILIGSSEEIETKDVIAREILSEHGDAVVYVNVRTVERPTWRGVDSEQ
jgi:cell division protein FtsQ